MMFSDLLDVVGDRARANDPALRGSARTWTYGDLAGHIQAYVRELRAHPCRVVASLLDNGPEWIMLDLACAGAGIVHLPLPQFFTPAQRAAALSAAGADALVCHASLLPMLQGLPSSAPSRPLPHGLALQPLALAPVPMPAGTRKITFTSGSTGQPKGVCLGGPQMLAVSSALAEATRSLDIRVHLSALPLPVLLENVAGVYAALLEGAAVDVPPLSTVGLHGSSQFDPARFHMALQTSGSNSVIMLPQMLRAYAGWLMETSAAAPPALRLVAVGGAAVGQPLLETARRLGLPAYEGYGLSEGASVQCLNLPGADLPGAAGRPLRHARIRIAADGEIEIAGSIFLGYLGDAQGVREWLPTGDLGHIDAHGFLHVAGRKKNVLITGFGRNVSPEWVEVALASHPVIRHAVVFGEGDPGLGAVIWPQGAPTDHQIQSAVDRANQDLPDYARVARWMRARADYSAESGMATSNGRPVRAAIIQQHADLFQASASHFMV